jgi:hypothetical protein
MAVNTEYPFPAGRVYRPGDCPVAEAAFGTGITTSIFEEYTETDIDEMGLGIGKVAWHLARRAAPAAGH